MPTEHSKRTTGDFGVFCSYIYGSGGRIEDFTRVEDAFSLFAQIVVYALILEDDNPVELVALYRSPSGSSYRYSVISVDWFKGPCKPDFSGLNASETDSPKTRPHLNYIAQKFFARLGPQLNPEL